MEQATSTNGVNRAEITKKHSKNIVKNIAQTIRLLEKLIKELKDLIYKQNEKQKSHNIHRKVNRLG